MTETGLTPRLNQNNKNMETILNQIPSAKDEFRGWARECKVYRNQGWRNGILTYRLGNVSKAEYVTYQMPNGRIFRTAVDMIAEQHGQTMKVATRDMIIENKFA